MLCPKNHRQAEPHNLRRIAAGVPSTLTLAGAAPLENATGVCADAEPTCFSCRTTRSRWIGLCGNPPGAFHYRFGTPARIELDYPPPADLPRQRFLFAHYTRYQTERGEASFSNGAVDHAVFDYRKGRQRHAGVRVATDPGRTTELPCSSTIHSRLNALAGALPCDADNARNGGNCPSKTQE